MKLKALGLALAVASLATSAHAAELALSGNVEVQLIEAAGEDLDVAKDAVLALDASEKIGSVNYFGSVAYNLATSENDGTLYVGADFGTTSVLVGQADLATDGFGVGQDIEAAVSGSAFATDTSDDQIQVSTSFGPVSLVASTDVKDEEKATIDLLASASFGSVDLALGYQSYEADASSESVDTFGISAATSFGPVGLGIAYSDNDTTTVTHLGGTYSMFGFGYDVTEVGEEETTGYYVNATKSLSDAVSVFAEVSDVDGSAYLVGANIDF